MNGEGTPKPESLELCFAVASGGDIRYSFPPRGFVILPCATKVTIADLPPNRHFQKFKNTVICSALTKSIKNAPNMGTTRNARGAGPYLSTNASMFAIALAVVQHETTETTGPVQERCTGPVEG